MKTRTLGFLVLTSLLALLLPLSSVTSSPIASEHASATADESAPSAVTNLAASAGSEPGTVELTWVASGDDASAGTAATYVVRYNTATITDATWGTSTDVSGEPTPSTAGTVEHMTVSGLTPGQTYHFAIKVQDEVPNTSGLSNSPSAGAQTWSNRVHLPLTLSSASNVPIEIPETTEVLTQTTTQHLSQVSDDGAVFTFTQSTPSLDAVAAGDVVVGDVTGNTPSGFLRKVTAVESVDNQFVLETEQATLEEAIESGEAHTSRLLTPEDVQSTVQAEGVSLATASRTQNGLYFQYVLEDVVLYDADGNPSTADDQITANGSIRLEPSFDFGLTVNDWELEELSFTTSAEETAELEVNSEIDLVSIGEEKEIARHIFSPITLPIGPVPVVLVPVLTVSVGVDGSVHVGVTTGVTQEANLTAGVQYLDDTWSPVSDFSNQFHYGPPTLSAGLDLKGHADTQLSLLLYGVTGPYSELSAYVQLEADTAADPWWELYGGLEMPVGVEIEVFSHVVAGYETTVIDYKLPLAQAQTNTPPDLPSSPSPADGATAQSLDTDLGWNGGDLDGDSVTYDVYFEPDDSTPDVLVSDDQAGTTYDPGRLDASTDYYWRVVAQDEHGATTAGPVWRFVAPASSNSPLPPTALSATVMSQTEITLTWDYTGTDATDFHIERSADAGTTWNEVGTVPADTTTYTDDGLDCGTAYRYRVRAHRHSDGQFSTYSNAVEATTADCSSGIYLIDDHFDGTSLDTNVWGFGTNSANSGYTVENSLVIIDSGTTDGGGAWILSNQEFTPGVEEQLVLETRTAVSVADAGYWGFWGDNYEGMIGFSVKRGEGLFQAIVRPDSTADPIRIDIPDVDPTVWHMYRIEVAAGTAYFYVDDALVATHSQGVPYDKPMHLWLNRGSLGEHQTLLVDYVRLKRGESLISSPIVEEFDSASGFTQTDPDVYIDNGKVHWTVHRDEGQQYVYRSIPGFSGDVRLTVRGQIDSWTNNCKVRAGIGDKISEVNESDNDTGISVNFGYTGGGCPTNGPVITANGASMDYSESNCSFTGDWLWINGGTPYTATLTIANGAVDLSVPDAGSASGTPYYGGIYDTLFVGMTGRGDYPQCSGTVDSITVEPLSTTTSTSRVSTPTNFTATTASDARIDPAWDGDSDDETVFQVER